MNSLPGNRLAMENPLLLQTRRHFFRDCALGLGSLGLASLLGAARLLGAETSTVASPLTVRPPHFPPRAKSVIYLFMAGGPSQLELFDHKPKLLEYKNQPTPELFIKGRR